MYKPQTLSQRLFCVCSEICCHVSSGLHIDAGIKPRIVSGKPVLKSTHVET